MGDLLSLEFVSHVSLVDDPAVDKAEYLVAKRADSSDIIPGSDSSPGSTEAETPIEVIKNMSDSDHSELVEAIKEAAAEGVQEGLSEAQEQETETDPDPEGGSDLEDQVETLTEQVSELTDTLSTQEQEPEGEEGQEAEGGEDPEGDDPDDDSLEKRLETLEKAVEQGPERKGAASILDSQDEDEVLKADSPGVVDTAGAIQKSREERSQEDT